MSGKGPEAQGEHGAAASPCCGPSRESRLEVGDNPPAGTSGPTDGMVELDGGAFLMGTEDPDGFPADGEGPVREISLELPLEERHREGNTLRDALIDAGILRVRPVLITVAALAIATFKAALVILFFMHVKYSTRLTWAVVLGSIFWLGILLTLTMSDYLTRVWRTYG